MTDLPPVQPESQQTPASKTIGLSFSKRENKVRFAIGFFGFFILNGIGFFVSYGIPTLIAGGNTPSSLISILFATLPYFFLLLNLGLMIGLSIPQKTRWVGIGFLAGVAASFILGIIAGIFLTIFCFFMLSQG
jgi:hypothetical protein